MITPVNTILFQPNTQSQPSFGKRFLPKSFPRPKHIKPFFAYRDFVRYNPLKINFGEYTIPVHNEGIAQKLKPNYTSESFLELFNFAKKKGTFEYSLNPETGFIKTSQINRKENPLMSDLIWTTDTCHNITLLKHDKPEACTTVFNSLTKFYDKQQNNFDNAIANPDKYAQNEFWVSKVGVGHAFIPSSGLDHPWFTHTRLESAGMYIQTASDLISEGFNGAKYGYKSFSDIPKNVINTIANFVKYLKAINYPQARSCGAWEEQTFINSLTSDTSIINQGMRDLLKLVYAPTNNPELIKLRTALMSSKHGDVFSDKKGLYDLLKAGERRIEDIHYTESMRSNLPVESHYKKCLGRDVDAAMAFVPQTEKINPGSLYGDSIAKIGMLRKIERNLVRDNGALRYKGDEYLNLDYHTLKNQWTDNKKQNEAEWFLVSEIAKGYGKVVADLLEDIRLNGVNNKNKKLFDYAFKKQTEFINRSYARITPANMTKANKYSCPGYKVPEAYEAVTTNTGIKFVPGAHTPLTWAESSLFEASNQFLTNLETVKKLNI